MIEWCKANPGYTIIIIIVTLACIESVIGKVFKLTRRKRK